MATQYGLGTPDSELNDELRARASLYLSYWLVSYTVSTNLAKTGIAAALLRLTTLRRYRYPIYAIMVSTPLFVLGMIVVMVYTCRPLGAQFDPDLGPCPTRHFMADFSYAFTGVTVTLDWACAIIPYLLLRDLQMLLRTKISLLALLTFGGLAGVCALIRVPYLRYYYINEDQLYYFGNTVLWSTIENAIGLIAASLPPIHKLLGLYAAEHEGSCSNSGAGATETIGGTPLSQRDLPAQLRTLRARRMTQSDAGSVGSSGSGGGPWHHRLERADSSREHIIRTDTIRSSA
ncbi:putative integral membrane protein [Eutypa lata UCREL1]|uniref:Putative integral membrane protein n=1 Tax=Eutypa lata (strain UCR-EL1) TaxID=1287681 RepID=M7TEN4_EUTLA|nr:putative integral membrane protein [Eutypa lata UCREL1]